MSRPASWRGLSWNAPKKRKAKSAGFPPNTKSPALAAKQLNPFFVPLPQARGGEKVIDPLPLAGGLWEG